MGLRMTFLYRNMSKMSMHACSFVIIFACTVLCFEVVQYMDDPIIEAILINTLNTHSPWQTPQVEEHTIPLAIE